MEFTIRILALVLGLGLMVSAAPVAGLFTILSPSQLFFVPFALILWGGFVLGIFVFKFGLSLFD
jgi:hypothetical protein